MHHKCSSCINFTEYYLKQNNYFAISGCGDCKLKKQQVSRHSTCEGFKKRVTRSEVNVDAIYEKLEEVVTEVNGIKLILEAGKKD